MLNTATEDETKSARARAGLRKELERSTLLGVGAVCFHPGAATSGNRAAADRVAAAITEALEAVKGGTRLLVEDTAGAGMTVGRTAAEVGAILDAVPARLRQRTGYGLDTCHLFASGHDITRSQAELERILDEFEEATGTTPSFFHLNDSEGRPRIEQGPPCAGWIREDPARCRHGRAARLDDSGGRHLGTCRGSQRSSRLTTPGGSQSGAETG